jgi:hypothetical protein
MRAPRVTRNTILGAACGYVLLAYFFTFAYATLLSIQPDAIQGAAFKTTEIPHFGVIGANSQLLYFSATTLTTLGYGDILPTSPAARTLATLQMIAGQLYLAAFVARLVGALHPAGSPR